MREERGGEKEKRKEKREGEILIVVFEV